MALRIACRTYFINGLKHTMGVRGLASKCNKHNIGFIGLGNMGCHMSGNLIKKGHNLHVYDVSKDACSQLQSKGATVYENTTDLVKNVDFVITMLPNNEIVWSAYEQMTSEGVNDNIIFIDSSTIDPGMVRKVQEMICDKGARFVDAPVSGGVMGAENATLTFMVGGTEDEYCAVKPVLEGMGQRIVHCGSYGMGQVAKLANNMMLGISMIGVSEAMNLAIRMGLKPKVFSDIINTSTGRCWVTDIYNPVPGVLPTAPASNDYKSGFSTDLIAKDLGLAVGIASDSKTPIPMGAMAFQFYRMLQLHGLGHKDFSIIYKFMQENKN